LSESWIKGIKRLQRYKMQVKLKYKEITEKIIGNTFKLKSVKSNNLCKSEIQTKKQQLQDNY